MLLFSYGTLCCQGFYFRMNCALSLLLNVFPHVENWEFDWKAELPSFWLSEEMKQKQTGRLKLRSWVTSWRQLRSVWILLSLLLPGISIEIKVLLHWLFHILAMVLPLELVVSWMTMIVIYHWQLVSLQFYACDFYVSMVTWNTLADADGFGKFNFDGADELCNSTHMSELTGSWGTFIFQHSVPLFCAGVYFTGSFSITLLLFLPVDVHGWAKLDFLFIWRGRFLFYHSLDILISYLCFIDSTQL